MSTSRKEHNSKIFPSPLTETPGLSVLYEF